MVTDPDAALPIGAETADASAKGPRYGRVRSTYRLQLRPGFGFDEAAVVLPYLTRLGVTHVFCSPYVATVPGSTHGYDVVDHRRVREGPRR